MNDFDIEFGKSQISFLLIVDGFCGGLQVKNLFQKSFWQLRE
jgi:hypothetical protein